MIVAHKLTRSFFAILLTLLVLSGFARAADPGDLIVSKTGPPAIAAGSNITYTITVSINGNVMPINPVVNVMLSDPLPSGWTVVSVSSNQGGCVGAGTSAASCDIGTVTFQNPVTVTLTAHVPALCQPATATNTATVRYR